MIPASSENSILKQLRALGKFIYVPNDGNLGDLLIAEATRQFFRRHKLPYSEYRQESLPESYNLVYGGGGRFVPHWGSLAQHIELLTNARVQRCVILPQSIAGVDDFVQALDARHTVFCRTLDTYRYCLSLNTQAQFQLADDMALSFDLDSLEHLVDIPLDCVDNSCSEEVLYSAALLRNSLAERMRKASLGASSLLRQGGQSRRYGFVLRQDRERNSRYRSCFSCDLSLFWSRGCLASPLNPYLLRAFAGALQPLDVVVSDRLHVCILAFLMGKEVYMLDNDYGKLKGVYDYSLRSYPNVHYLGTADFPAPLNAAWRKLNAPLRVFFFKLKRKCRRLKQRLFHP